MRVLLITSTGSGYAVQLWHYIKKYYPDVKYSLLTIDRQKEFYQNNLELEDGEGIYCYHFDKFYVGLKKTIESLPEFDIIHPLWMEWQLGLQVKHLLKKSNNIFISVGGSDLYRDSKRLHVRFFQKRLIRYAKCISSENEQTRDFFYKVYGKNCSKAPHTIIRFGVDILDEVEQIEEKEFLREKWNIPKDKIVVALGHNGRREHQHLEMIKAIGKLDVTLRDKLFLLIPMTYLVPEESYVDEIKEQLNQTGVEYSILRDYMNTKEMAETVSICDMMIHVQTTDQLSSTMLAHMYAGNLVIAGSWLPYGSLKAARVKFWNVDRVDELEGVVKSLVENVGIEKKNCVGNKEKIYDMSSWERMSKLWYEAYMKVV